MALLVATQVVFRYVFNDSLFWGEEAGRLLLVHVTFIGGGVARIVVVGRSMVCRRSGLALGLRVVG